MSALDSSTSGAARVIEPLRTSTRWLRFAAIAVLLIGAVAGCLPPAAAVSPSTGAPSAPASAAAPQVLPGDGPRGRGDSGRNLRRGRQRVDHPGARARHPRPRRLHRPRLRGHCRDRGHGHCGRPDARGLAFWEVQSVFNNPCKAGKHGVDPGPTVADLARALSAQPLRAGSNPVPVTVAGYHGLYVETSVPAHIDFGTCQDGYFDSWISTGGGGRYQQGPGQRDSLWILDVGGYRLVIDGEHMPGATQAQIDEITGMVKTLTFRTTS